MRYDDLYANYYQQYFEDVRNITYKLDFSKIHDILNWLIKTKWEGGRVFVIGLGGSAANASHMVTDLRKMCGIDAYAPTDNVAELTARANDENFDRIFWKWLECSKLNKKDCLFILSVSGGNPKVSSGAIQDAIAYAHWPEIGAKVLGICGDPDGELAQKGDVVVMVPIVNPNLKYAHAEEFQAIIWHFLVNHPDLKV